MSGTIVQNANGTASLVNPVTGAVLHSVGGPNAAALLQQAYPSATVSGAAAPAVAPASASAASGAASTASPTPTRDDVVRAYESILGRRPESEDVINFYTNPANLRTGAGLTGIPALSIAVNSFKYLSSKLKYSRKTRLLSLSDRTSYVCVGSGNAGGANLFTIVITYAHPDEHLTVESQAATAHPAYRKIPLKPFGVRVL